jgi:predicted transcriptional regulator
MKAIVPPTNQPPTNQPDWHGILKISPLIVILLFMQQSQRSITQFELAERFSIDRKTAAGYLRQLSSRGLVAKIGHHEGYALAADGRSFLNKIGTVQFLDSSLKESLDLTLKDSKDKKEGKKELGIFWTVPNGLTTERILAETGKLFGFQTVLHGIEDVDPRLALAWVAQAYDQRRKLKAPQVLVYRRLQVGILPDVKYCETDPSAFLPNEFLHTLGMAELKVIEIESEYLQSGDQSESESTPAEPSADETITRDLQRAWQIVLNQLQLEMPKASFGSWMADTAPVHFSDGVLSIAARNQYACDWLESRIAKTAERLLVGIMNENVVVNFVVARVALKTEV